MMHPGCRVSECNRNDDSATGLSQYCRLFERIEPLLPLLTRAHSRTELSEINKYFFEIAKKKNFTAKNYGRRSCKRKCEGMKEVPEEIRKLFKTALEISPENPY